LASGRPARIGVTASYLAASGAGARAGVVALAVGDDRAAAPRSATPARPALAPARLRLGAAGSGALGLGLEVLWTRLFAQVLHNSVYSFTAIALVFLVALALGAGMAALLLRHVAPTTVAAVAQVTAAVTTNGGVWLFVYWTDGLTYVGMQSGLSEYLGRIVTLAAATAGPAALASGALLPALWAAWGGRGSVAHPLGDLSAANMLGGVIGAVAAGFVIVPTIGVRGGLLAAAVAYIVLADLLASPQSRFRPLAY